MPTGLGNASDFAGVVTASGINRSALIGAMDDGIGSNMASIFPARRWASAGVEPRPRYGTRVISTSAIALNISIPMCWGVPTPAKPILSLPGLAPA
jgi:hypothetical protein